MTHAEKYIIETYSGFFDSLSSIGKIELLEKLAKSLKRDNKAKEKNFFKSFGAFADKRSADEIASEIRESRKFRERDFKF